MSTIRVGDTYHKPSQPTSRITIISREKRGFWYNWSAVRGRMWINDYVFQSAIDEGRLVLCERTRFNNLVDDYYQSATAPKQDELSEGA